MSYNKLTKEIVDYITNIKTTAKWVQKIRKDM